MRLVVELSTEYLRDKFCIPVLDKKYTIEALHEEIQKRYEEWHSFKVYSFDIVSDQGRHP